MKQARYGGMPIKVPSSPRNLANLPRWADEVLECIKLLRDRPVITSGTPARGVGTTTRPWQVTSNGDDTVTINAGRVVWFDSQGTSSVPNSPWQGKTLQYAGADLTVTGSKTITAVFDTTSYNTAADDTTNYLWTQTFEPATVVVSEDPTLSGDELSIPIATVTLTDGVASVTEQIIDYNPIIDVGFTEDYFS